MIQNKLLMAIQQTVSRLYPEQTVQNIQLARPAKSEFGDYSTNVAMILAKKVGQSPQQVASTLIEELKKDEYVSGVVADIQLAPPGFVNFHLTNQSLWTAAEHFLTQPEHHQDKPGKGKKMMVEFSSPNIAKPFNVGHLRSTIIGDSLARIFAYMGYTILRDNHLGDWGTQYGKLAYAVENWGDWGAIEQNPINELFKLYVRFHQEEEDNPALSDAGREYFKRLEQKDSSVIATWQKLVDLSLKDFNRLYAQLGVQFDMQLGESFYEPMLSDIIDECKSSGIARQSKGALLVFFDDDPELKDTPLMIQKSNGTSTYGTRDLAGIKYRFNEFKLDRLLIEIGNEQQLYFKQIIKASEMLGWIEPGELTHVGHGLFMLPTGKMSTRKGETVWVTDLIAELEQKAGEIVAQREELSEVERKEVVSAIAIGALKYNDLSQNRLGNVVFDKDKSLALDGNSAPYLQYTIARSKSVLRSGGVQAESSSITALQQAASQRSQDLQRSERDIVAHIALFDEVVQEAARNLLPNTLANYLFQLAQKYNSFYQTCPILNAEAGVRESRLLIVCMTANVLEKGLSLLGIESVERM
jgi:arginyl-tRNA synthetase